MIDPELKLSTNALIGCRYWALFLEDNKNNELSSLNSWLIANRLSLNIAKAEFMIIGSRQRLINHDVSNLNICVNNTQIKRVQHTKPLGITIDENLT